MLNDYLDEANADARNIQRAIYQSATGTSYKAILKEEDWTENGDLPPFRIFIPYPGDCYIVYSQRNGKPMLSVQILKDEDEQQYYLCYSKKQFFKITNGKVTEYGINGLEEFLLLNARIIMTGFQMLKLQSPYLMQLTNTSPID